MKRELFGVSRKTFFKWLKRYRERYRFYGKEGLINKRAGTKKNGRRTSSSVEDLIVKMRLDAPFCPLRIAYELSEKQCCYFTSWGMQCFEKEKLKQTTKI